MAGASCLHRSTESFADPHLAGSVEGQDLGPDEDERLPQVGRCGLQQLEHVGIDAHAEGQIHRPGTHVQEVTQQPEGAQAVHLAQQHLQPGP